MEPAAPESSGARARLEALGPDLEAALREHEARILRAIAAPQRCSTGLGAGPSSSVEPRAGGGEQHAQAPEEDPLTSALRSAVRAELGDLLAEGGPLRRAVRSEVEGAMGGLRGAPGLATARISQNRRTSVEEKGSTGSLSKDEVPQKSTSSNAFTVEHFSKFVDTITELDRTELESLTTEDNFARATYNRMRRLRTQWRELEEPPRSGCFADFVNGNFFEIAVSCLIIFNVLFMVYSTNLEMQNPHKNYAAVEIGNLMFQVCYTVELIMKLLVHRQWFFVNESWKVNLFDFILVITGFVTMAIGSKGASFIRVFRLLKFGKAINALKVMAYMRHLRALIVCLQGSVASLFWSLLMLFIVYALFSLLMMQLIVMHLQESGEAPEEAGFELFGSVQQSILTLYMASTGGDDWSTGYQVIQVTGPLGVAAYLFFISFVQFALINIITGIFVESAMMTLSPDMMTLAQENIIKDKENAMNLTKLCQIVDHDQSGKLTREQFEDGLRRKQIPMLLNLLGLQKHHVLEFFSTMAEAANDDGQVEITRFVEGCMGLKGTATNFDIQKLHAEIRDASERHEEALAEIVALLHGDAAAKLSSSHPETPRMAT